MSENQYREAVACVVATQKGSTSLIQRVLYIGYNNAARLAERMEAEGILSKPNSAGARKVMIQHMRDVPALHGDQEGWGEALRHITSRRFVGMVSE